MHVQICPPFIFHITLIIERADTPHALGISLCIRHAWRIGNAALSSLRPVRGTLVPRFLLSSFLRLAMPVIKICSVSCVSFVSFIHFWGSFWVFLDQIYPQTDNTDNIDILFFGFALFALSRPKVQIVQIVQCIFFRTQCSKIER